MPSDYITPQGRAALEAELAALWERRAATTAALAAAAAEGDRSENAEYIYRKKELRGIDRRLGYLQRRLPRLRVVDRVQGHDRVWFGAWVTVEGDAGAKSTWRIVGPDELGHRDGYISVDAPLARALLGKAHGEKVPVTVAGRRFEYTVVNIAYQDEG
jgi:transcription elongation factor GreB